MDKGKRGNAIAVFSGIVAAVFSVGRYTLLMLNNYNGVVPYVTQFNRSYDIFIDTIITEEDSNYDDDYDESTDEFILDELPINQ